MKTLRTSIETIEDFLAQRRIAAVGVSRNASDFSTQIFREFCRLGYDMVPVNPNSKEIEGRSCFASVGEVTPTVDTALVTTSPKIVSSIVRNCAAAGVRRIWVIGGAAQVQDAVAFCEERGISIIHGECPFMFLPETAAFHRVHGFIRKITGRYPQRAAV